MKFPESWLAQWVKPTQSSADIGELLTMSGIEIEQIEPAGAAFSGVVVAEVLEKDKHPNADRLSVCRVSTGNGEPLTIVCGAPNVAVGLKVPCATIGAVLPGDFCIKKSKLRGVASEGMLCSGRELGIPSDVDGLLVLPDDAPVGMSVRDYLNLDDQILTVKITPNRADCLSVQGIAREVATLSQTPLLSPLPQLPQLTVNGQICVESDAQSACPLYYAAQFEGVNTEVQTPQWMKERLERCGLRSIYPLVDITNYVMLELGQPLHAFDADKLDGDPIVRWGGAGEQLTLLDGQVVDCEGLLVIADQVKVLALAGVMGGQDSGITQETKRVILESAFFDPITIARAARQLNLNTDAAYRFERGVDFGQTKTALAYACQLIQTICNATLVTLKQADTVSQQRKSVTLRLTRLNRILGMQVEAETVASIFERLFFEYVEQDGIFSVTPPTYRFDLTREEDLIEEVARVYGYDRISVTPPQGTMTMASLPETQRTLNDIRSILSSRGYHEAINFSFIDEQVERTLLNNEQPIRLINPIASQLNVMRSSLIGSLVLDIASNLARKQTRIRLFEIGRVFLKDNTNTQAALDAYTQPMRIAAVAYGDAYAEQWGLPARPIDFFDVKGDLACLLNGLSEITFRAATHPAMHPGRCAEVLCADQVIGIIGELHPKWQQLYRMPSAPVLFELDYAAVAERKMPSYADLPKFQPVWRDLAFIVDESVAAQDITDVLNQTRLPFDHAATLFDVYRGAGVSEGKKSLAYRLMFQDKSATLTDAQIDDAMARLIEMARTRNALLRS